MSDKGAEEPQGLSPLSEAIGALRRDLLGAWQAGQGDQLRFRPSPVELTLNVGVTKVGKGQAGVKWWLFSVGGEASRESVVTQTIKLTLDPVLLDEHGNPTEFLIADRDEDTGAEGGGDVPLDDSE